MTRRNAELEAVADRVQLAIADMVGPTGDYAAWLRHLGSTEVERRGLGWRFAYGSPFVRTHLVTATRPD